MKLVYEDKKRMKESIFPDSNRRAQYVDALIYSCKRAFTLTDWEALKDYASKLVSAADELLLSGDLVYADKDKNWEDSIYSKPII